MASRLILVTLIIVAGLFGLTLCRPPTPTVAKVQVLTGASVMTDEETVRLWPTNWK
jgi:hypothetical protein